MNKTIFRVEIRIGNIFINPNVISHIVQPPLQHGNVSRACFFSLFLQIFFVKYNFHEIFREIDFDLKFFWIEFASSDIIIRMMTDRILCLADSESILEQCSLTTSIFGNPILWDTSHYSYYRIKKQEAKFKSLWKCRHPKCKARVHTNDIENVIIRRRNEHSHQNQNVLTLNDIKLIEK